MTVYMDPRIRPVKAETISEELKARSQWVVWKAVGDNRIKYPTRRGAAVGPPVPIS